MERPKPTGKTGPLSFGPEGVQRKFIDWPATKGAIELVIAKQFCAGKSGMHSQLKRYGAFESLEQQGENDLDFKVMTPLGPKWLELAEFAPLDKFGRAYKNVGGNWSVAEMRAMVRALIDKKAAKGYGPNVILLIYVTHETLFIPPPIIHDIRDDLKSAEVPFEAIYFLAPHDLARGSVWEIHPGDPTDQGPRFPDGDVQIGFGGFKVHDGS